MIMYVNKLKIEIFLLTNLIYIFMTLKHWIQITDLKIDYLCLNPNSNAIHLLMENQDKI